MTRDAPFARFKLATFATAAYEKSAKSLCIKAINRGVNDIELWGPENISESFLDLHSETFGFSRGFGYFLWKPHLLLDCMERMRFGDKLLYLDAGILPRNKAWKSLKHLNDETQITLWEIADHRVVDWTDISAARELSSQGLNFGDNSRMCWAGAILFTVSEESIRFTRDWLELCSNPKLLRPDSLPDALKNKPRFWHRHDQTLLSILSLKERKIVNRIPPEDPNSFFTLFDLHRKGEIASLTLTLHSSSLSKYRRNLVGSLPTPIREKLRTFRAKSAQKKISSDEMNSLRNAF